MSSDPFAAGDARPRVLVVDDDADIVALLARYLGSNGFVVSSAASGADLREALAGALPDLVLLDLGLPDEDGLSLLQHLRQQWRLPVIVVSGRGEAVERVVGLELGADDYIAKPFDFRELLARVRSVLRRAPAVAADVPAPAPTPIRRLAFEGMVLDLAARRLADAGGRDIPLTTGEFDLLRALLQHPNEVLSRDRLMNTLHGREAGPFDRAIDVGIARLRRKIERDPATPELIRSVRGAGYLLAADVCPA
ncbi:response regulator [Luteimonas sp. MC1825]|uniref:response regulator n=1 Tax=Luteimonas sp. MC1825 TaxID=2761107 RepID=UPI00161F28E9|nr:response regulator [Luteimonas sp. MC1825]MBB6599342.1 response regulator [Luteimonas sp. MC1825]QOC87055.1 response regulator [Luteimonas sp. MC1825]